MRVGFLTYGLDRPLTGISRYTVELAQALRASQDVGPHLLLLTAGRPIALGANDCPHIALPGCRLLPGLLTIGNALIPYASQRHGLDIVHDPTGTSPFLFGAAGAKTVVTLHDAGVWSYPGMSSLLDSLIYRYWLPHILARIDAVITASEQSRHDIQRFLAVSPQRLHVIPYGVAPYFHPLPSKQVKRQLLKRFELSAPYILYVGTLTIRKNLERALEAFALLIRQFPDVRFVLAGARTWKQTPIESILERLGLFKSVQLTGPVTEADLHVLYSGAELFFFPSLYEGFGLPLLEAMACGTPVVCSNVASLPEVVGEAAILADPYNVEALAEAMARVLKDNSLRELLKQKGLTRAAQFTWERTAKETARVYRQVLEEPRA